MAKLWLAVFFDPEKGKEHRLNISANTKGEARSRIKVFLRRKNLPKGVIFLPFSPQLAKGFKPL